MFASKHNKEADFFWTELLGYSPDMRLIEVAMTHRSCHSSAAGMSCPQSNERLEFLGDAFIGLVVAEELYRLYPNRDEGFLTRARAHVVCRETLNRVAHDIGIASHVTLGISLRENAADVYGNALEALVGAIYLDAGYSKARDFVERYIIADQTHISKLAEKESDFKSRLLEWAQANKRKVEFVQLSDRYDAKTDSHTFVCQVLVDGQTLATSTGSTKKMSQQMAAKKSLRVVNSAKNGGIE